MKSGRVVKEGAARVSLIARISLRPMLRPMFIGRSLAAADRNRRINAYPIRRG
jgi:hypothetical protein